MEKLILLYLHDKKKSRLIYLGLLFLQMVISYWLFDFKLCLTNLPDLLYVPVAVASFLFPVPVAISQGLMAGGLLSLAYTFSVGGDSKEILQFVVQQTLSFASAAAIIGILRNKVESFYLRKEEIFFFDEFTGLPNISAFDRDIRKLQKEKISQRYKVVLAEIVNHNEISAAFGQPTIFKMLSEMRKNSQYLFGRKDCVYQIQLDTLLILIQVNEDGEELNAIRDSKPIINVDGIPILVNTICGVCEYPRDGTTSNDLIKRGYIALQEAHHRNLFLYEYHPSLEVPQKILLLGQIEKAMEKKEIIFYYQPILNKDGSVHSVEALVRWSHPQMGLLSPSEFIPDLELTGIANHLVDYSLLYNLENLRLMIDDGFLFPMAVNISITNLQQPDFGASRHHHQPDRGRKEIHRVELLENIVFNQTTQNRIRELYKHNILFAIDDFGTGNSNVAFIRNFENLKVKIDRAFVPADPTDSKERVIIEAFVKMFVDQGLRLIVEGAESREQVEYLQGLGVAGVQGYYLSHPMTIDRLIEYVENKEYLRKL